jgi:hypothetical protein
MAAILFPELQFSDENGVPLAAGTIETYIAGTSTPQVTYSDSTGNVSVGTSVTLDAEGRPNSGNGIWLGSTTTYKFIIKDSAGNTIQTVDNISSGGFTGSSSFVLASADDTLSNGRTLTTSTTNTVVDAGAGSTIQIQRTALTGDVTAPANSNTTTIATGAVSLDKLANIATDTLIGRDTAGTGVPEAITLATSLEFSGSGSIRRSALTGDVTASAGSNSTTIANDAVTFPKMQNIATDSLIGRDTASSGDPENITLVNTHLAMNGSGSLGIAAILDLGGNTSVEIPNGTGTTVSVAGQIGVDTDSDNTNITHGSMIFHDGSSTRYIPSFAAYPTTNGHVLTYNSSTKVFEWSAAPGFGGGAATSEPFLTITNSAGLTNERSIAVSNGIAATDGGANSTYTIRLDITGLSADTEPDIGTDYVATFDASASTNKKVLLSNIPVYNIGYTSNLYYPLISNFPGEVSTYSGALSSYLANQLYYFPMMVRKKVNISGISIYCTAHNSSHIRIGIYASDSNGTPTGSPIAESSSIGVGSIGIGDISIPATLEPNVLYYAAIVMSSAVPQYIGVGSSNNKMFSLGTTSFTNTVGANAAAGFWNQNHTFGALPVASATKFTTQTSDSYVLPYMMIKVA